MAECRNLFLETLSLSLLIALCLHDAFLKFKKHDEGCFLLSNVCFTGTLLLSFFAFVACRDKCYGLKYDYQELIKYNQAEFEVYDFRPG
ncbi:MAG: hypothetical protein HC913_05270 [Microscillaceae bacterium]|nr:hypothetical protein [Microscillaceae bacterium]